MRWGGQPIIIVQTLKGWGSVVRWGGQPIIIVQTLKGWGSVTRWRGQPKGEDNQWFSFPLRNPPAFLSIAALIFHQSADWFVFVRGGFFMRTTRAGRGQSRKDWQRGRISEPSCDDTCHGTAGQSSRWIRNPADKGCTLPRCGVPTFP